MFESLVLPFLITAVALCVMVVLATICAPAFGMKPFYAFMLSVLLAGMAFIPSCTAINWIADQFRYGEFNYLTADQIDDYHIEIPPSATDITLHKTASGHHARFTVAEAELQPWLADIQTKYAANGLMETYTPNKLDKKAFERKFGEFGWEYPADNYGLETPYASNGAGSTIWYSPLEKRAYLDAGYW